MKFGTKIATNMAMIATTIIISISVNPRSSVRDIRSPFPAYAFNGY
jgi:hypothetical protein